MCVYIYIYIYTHTSLLIYLLIYIYSFIYFERFPKTRNVDRAIDRRLDPDSEQRLSTLARARPKQDPATRTFELAAESDYVLPRQAKKRSRNNVPLQALLRPICVLRFWNSEGLTQAES